jgi:nitrite reductase/ring-hydroxylating ferredoxin subunit
VSDDPLDTAHDSKNGEALVVLPSDELACGEPALIRAIGQKVAVVRAEDGRVYAVDDACPHEGYPLSKGTVKDCVLTCPWHNFKFDLKDGACIMGDEAVRTHPVVEENGEVTVRIQAPDPAVEIPRAWASLSEALFERRMGQASRDVVRLLSHGIDPIDIAFFCVRYDADHAPYGTTHAMPVAVDALGYLDRMTGLDAVYPLMQPMELCSDSHVRRSPRQVAPALDPGHDPVAAGDRLYALVEDEELAAAEGLLRGAIEKGWGRSVIEPWLFRLCAQHFLDFGHALIYQVKIFDLLDAAGWHRAIEVLPAHLVGIVNGTRENVLPEWLWFRNRYQTIAGREPDLFAGMGQNPGVVNIEPLIQAFSDGSREEAFDAITHALEKGATALEIIDALSVGSSERMLRFDLAIDADHTISNGWLDVTHILTFTNALRHTATRFEHPDMIRLLYFAARFVHHARPLDRSTESIAPVKTGIHGSADEALGALTTAIEAKDGDRAVDAIADYLGHDGDVAPLRIYCEDLAFADQLVRPIVVGHLIKTAVAAFDEFNEMESQPRALRRQPLLALARLAASPISERRISRNSHNAINFIAHGKVPRELT